MSKITHEEIHEEIVKMLQESKAKLRGKIPQSVKDLTVRLRQPSWYNTRGERVKNPYWKKAYSRIANSRRPKKVLDLVDFKEHIDKTIVQPRLAREQERVNHNNNSISITLPSGMSAMELIDLIAIIRKSGAKCSL